MAREQTSGIAVVQEEAEDAVQRLHEWIAAVEADRLRLARAQERRAARERLCDQRYLEFVCEVLR